MMTCFFSVKIDICFCIIQRLYAAQQEIKDPFSHRNPVYKLSTLDEIKDQSPNNYDSIIIKTYFHT